MKEVYAKDLKAGDVVCDLLLKCKLKLVKWDGDEDPLFEHVSGEETYERNEENLIPFFKDACFYAGNNI